MGAPADVVGDGLQAGAHPFAAVDVDGLLAGLFLLRAQVDDLQAELALQQRHHPGADVRRGLGCGPDPAPVAQFAGEGQALVRLERVAVEDVRQVRVDVERVVGVLEGADQLTGVRTDLPGAGLGRRGGAGGLDRVLQLGHLVEDVGLLVHGSHGSHVRTAARTERGIRPIRTNRPNRR